MAPWTALSARSSNRCFCASLCKSSMTSASSLHVVPSMNCKVRIRSASHAGEDDARWQYGIPRVDEEIFKTGHSQENVPSQDMEAEKQRRLKRSAPSMQ
ncbi:hypothetical protein KC357_g176 [Hortaea werneckii]|nr:hypothetical protein KC357_g176 [Hortaea werneckii]